MPFFSQVLGYDVFNPDEFIPEFTADVGIKKGEKVDYAIAIDSNPSILIEAKWCNEPLDKHDSQLFRYFGTTTAKFGILTNGIIYKFYTDLEEQNKMDLKPFLEIDILNIKESLVFELKRFCKNNFNVEEIFNSASELKYSSEIKIYFSSQLKDPDDDFVKYILSHIYDGVKTQSVIDKFKPIIKKSLNTYINEVMSEKFTSALQSNDDISDPPVVEETEPSVEDGKRTEATEKEMESLYIVRALIGENIPNDDITYKATESYFGILYKNNTRKWICRLKLDGEKKYIIIPNENKKEEKYYIDGIDSLYAYKEQLLVVLDRYVKK